MGELPGMWAHMSPDEQLAWTTAHHRHNPWTAREGWAALAERLRPEIMRDPVADALRKMAEAVFAEQDAEIARLRDG